eukprot:TRINITY_DN3241_c0_g1_i1.p1 TRINITY_DN3241_c0_g1~~TRINITY_DN3241_c0_g1_i1.p1  ORF type:complete len:1075 (+),score=346.96 TRINITY_DN3241_c0_g1_i1:40-3225(+)
MAKLEEMRSIETRIQQEWRENHVFEVDVKLDQKKFFITFPYPYMNGRLHLGHCFSYAKADFLAHYKRMKGFNTLMPFGFHVTGMPIKACADKLTFEIEERNNPELYKKVVVEEEKSVDDALASLGKFKAKRTKLNQKGGDIKSQWEIMKSIGISDEDIPKFCDANYWVDYFPPYARTDLDMFGACVDWRRSFVTTDKNPFYDSFVRWQFTRLHEKGKVAFGKRITIYSPGDGQPCADHDRSVGEHVTPQEYTIVRLMPVELTGVLADLKDYKVIFPAATFRPETMYGQTNCWALPGGEYGAYEVRKGEVWIMGAHAANNASYQELTTGGFGESRLVKEINGDDLMGIALKAPLCPFEKVYILPMLSIKMDKGTGIVTSVPSDAPDDWMAYKDIREDAEFREKYGITDEMIANEPVPIIDIPDLGDMAAKTVCEELKIKNQHQRAKLDEAKAITYTKGFYDGVMSIGPYKGEKVDKVKDAVKADLLEQGMADLYSEPQRQVISRSGHECVCALVDQWYLTYGEDEWKALALQCVEEMNLYTDEIEMQQRGAVEWLKQWALSRSFGLGTRIPWDEQFLIESLSDSTAYQSFYTVAHLLHGENNLDGSKPGPLGVEAKDMTPEVWDYIYCIVDEVPETPIPVESLNKLRESFKYWYPCDLRTSGFELIKNHLTMYIYNHVCLWEDHPEFWPKGIRCNGHVTIDGEKMSKSTGNFITVEDGVFEYSADGLRFALAEAGDSLRNANFKRSTAIDAILALTRAIDWSKEVLDMSDKLRSGEFTSFDDIVLGLMKNCIDTTSEAYETMQYRVALREAWFVMNNIKGFYRNVCGCDENLHIDVVRSFIRTQALLMTPITPHWAEYIWKDILGEKGFIVHASYPTYDDLPASETDPKMAESKFKYIDGLTSNIRGKVSHSLKTHQKKNPNAVSCTKLQLFVSTVLPDWQNILLDLGVSIIEEDDKIEGKQLLGLISKRAKSVPELKPYLKFAMKWLAMVVQECDLREFPRECPFDEVAFLQEFDEYLKRTLEIPEIEIYTPESPELEVVDPKNKMGNSRPMSPSFTFCFD